MLRPRPLDELRALRRKGLIQLALLATCLIVLFGQGHVVLGIIVFVLAQGVMDRALSRLIPAPATLNRGELSYLLEKAEAHDEIRRYIGAAHATGRKLVRYDLYRVREWLDAKEREREREEYNALHEHLMRLNDDNP